MAVVTDYTETDVAHRESLNAHKVVSTSYVAAATNHMHPLEPVVTAYEK